MYLADLHVHSTYSDGSLSIPELIDFYGSRGFGCIAITDHLCESASFLGIAARVMQLTLTRDNFDDYLQTIASEAERALAVYNMVVIPGVEITKNTLCKKKSAHILGIGINSYIDPSGSVIEISRSIRSQGALAVAAHPVPTLKAEIQTLHLWNRREELMGELDAWEVASGKDLFPEVRESSLPKIATSDFHHPKNLNGWKSGFQCAKHPEAILSAVRHQDIGFYKYEDTHVSTSYFAKKATIQENIHATKSSRFYSISR